LRHACVNRSETRKKTQVQEQLTAALKLGSFEKRVHCETAVCNIMPARGCLVIKNANNKLMVEAGLNTNWLVN